MSDRIRPDAYVRATRALALGTLLALIALCLAWELLLAPTGRGPLALKALPLVFTLGGLLHHRLYTFRWLSLLVWLYVAEGLVRATSEQGPGRMLAVAEVGLCLLLFAACGAYIRRRLRPEARIAA
jgi:uncharacterized membrane protein